MSNGVALAHWRRHTGELKGVYGATNAFMLARKLSLHEEFANRNARFQSIGGMVDAALAGLDKGELISLLSLLTWRTGRL